MKERRKDVKIKEVKKELRMKDRGRTERKENYGGDERYGQSDNGGGRKSDMRLWI